MSLITRRRFGDGAEMGCAVLVADAPKERQQTSSLVRLFVPGACRASVCCELLGYELNALMTSFLKQDERLTQLAESQFNSVLASDLLLSLLDLLEVRSKPPRVFQLRILPIMRLTIGMFSRNRCGLRRNLRSDEMSGRLCASCPAVQCSTIMCLRFLRW